MDLKRITQVAVTVDDLPAAVRFYRDTLRLPFLFEAPGMAFFQCGDARILLGTENSTGQAVLLYFAVDDIAEAHKRLSEQGVSFIEAPKMIARLADRDVWLASFRDPAGNVHNLLSEVRR